MTQIAIGIATFTMISRARLVPRSAIDGDLVPRPKSILLAQ